MQRRSSDFLRQAYKITAARAELRSEHTDAAAVADLVDLVEEIDDVEAHGERLGARRGENIVCDPEIDGRIGFIERGVGKPGRQAAAVFEAGRKHRLIPLVGNS